MTHPLARVRRSDPHTVGFGRSILMRMFGRPRGMLGRLGGVIMARINKSAAAQVLDLLDVQPGDRILEIGFGPGLGIQLSAERASAGHVTGIDVSPEMLEQAAARNAQAIRGGRVDLKLGPVESLPFPDDSFDKAFAINSMQVWPDAVSGPREVRRVLKPGGKIAVGFTIHSGQAKNGVAELLTAAGFADVRRVDGEDLFCVTASK